MNFKRYIEASDTWVDSHYIMGTSTDTITTLPAVLYPNDTTATVGLKGQTLQSSIPSPTSPVMPQGTGERTGNLFDGNYTIAVMSVSGDTVTLNTTSSGRTAIVKCEPNTTYTVKKYSVSNRFIIAESDIKPVNGTAMSIIQNDSSISEYTFTTSNTTQYVAVYCSTSSEQAEPQLMFNLGATAFPYENFGYKIPISSANTTTPVYLGEVQSARRIKKLVLTGEENWIKSTAYQGSFYAAIITNYLSQTYQAYCSHASFVTSLQQYRKNSMAFNGAASRANCNLWMGESSWTVDDFKTYLQQQYAAGTPVTVWYVLATEETAVVNEPLMKIGDYADEVSGISIPTTAGANTLSVDTTLQPSEVSVNYKGWHPITNVHEHNNGAWN